MSSPRPARFGTPWSWLAHVATFGLISYVALANLRVADFAPDEPVYAHCGYLLATTRTFCNAGHPPLTKMWFGLWEYFLGNSIYHARIAAGIAAIATSIIFYFFLRRLVDWRWGLVGAALWGLTPQLGSNGAVADLVIRISRYALLESLLCLFVTLALYAGWRWSERDASYWAAITAFAAVAAALSKELGIIVAPVLIAVPAAVCWWRHRERIVRDALAALGGGTAALVGTFLAFGPVGGYHNFHAFLRAATQNDGLVGLTIIHGHLYSPPPWWATLEYGRLGMGTALCVIVIVGVALALAEARTRFIALYCLAVSTTIVISLIVSARALNFYWFAWEPPLLIAAGAGLAVSFSISWRRWVVVACLAVAGVLCASVVVDVATVKPGPYHQMASTITCRRPCTALSFTHLFVPGLYGINEILVQPGDASSIVAGFRSPVVIPKGDLQSGQRLANFVMFDSNSVTYKFYEPLLPEILSRLHELGYHRIFTSGTLSVYALHQR